MTTKKNTTPNNQGLQAANYEVPKRNNERLEQAQKIVEKFPVTKDMFPQTNIQPLWIVCK